MSPFYDFYCCNCNKTVEIFKKITDNSPKECGDCGTKMAKMIGTGIGLSIDTSFRDSSGEQVWFPKDKKPYFDKALQKTFDTPSEKVNFMKENHLVMDGSTDRPKNKLPIEAGDLRNSDYRKAYKLDA